MTTIPDVIFLVLVAVVGPLLDYGFFWPAFRRLSKSDPAWARRWLWASAMGHQWSIVAFGAAIWIASDRSWTAFGFTVPDGWRLGTSIAVVAALAGYHAYAVGAILRSADARASLRKQFEPVSVILPHTKRELLWFGGVSLTAGFCEEFLFRGYLIWALSPRLGWWGAAALSLAIFAAGHLYQGWNGVLRTGLTGAVLTLTVAIFGSLWPAIVLHAMIDFGAGVLAWLTLRGQLDEGPPGAAN